MPVTDRECRICHVTKPLETGFYAAGPTVDGHSRYWGRQCRECIGLKAKARKDALRPPAPPRVTERHCTTCGEMKPLAEFGRRKDRKGGEALRPICNACNYAKVRDWYLKNKERVHSYNREWRNAHKEQVAKYHRKKNLGEYGLTPDEYQAMAAEQDGRCAICGSYPTTGRKKLVIDHDHAISKKHVRGLLCSNCNVGLGNFHEDVEVLQNAIAYLQGKRGRQCQLA